MLDRILVFLRDLPGGAGAGRSRSSDDDPRVAAAALLFHVMDADGVRDKVERERLEKVLSEAYGIGGDDLEELVEAGEQADQEAVDLYAFTSVLMRHLDHEARVDFIEIMWEIVLADGEIHELEDNIVWRVAELLGIDSRDRVNARHRVQARMADAGDSARE